MDKHWSLIAGNFHGHGVAISPADLHHPLFGHTLDRQTHDNIFFPLEIGFKIAKKLFSPSDNRTDSPTVQARDTVCLKNTAFTLYSSGLNLHEGISGTSVEEYLRADFPHNAPVK